MNSFHGHAFREIGRLINIAPIGIRHVIGKELQGHGRHDRGEELLGLRDGDEAASVALDGCVALGSNHDALALARARDLDADGESARP